MRERGSEEKAENVLSGEKNGLWGGGGLKAFHSQKWVSNVVGGGK